MTAIYNPALEHPLRKSVIVWIVVVHLFALVCAPIYIYMYFSAKTIIFAIAYFFACHLSITIGAHRLYAHKSFEASRPLELVLLLLNTGVMQASVLWWAAFHRNHHRYADTPKDPYGILHGFTWAHIKWIPRALEEVPPSGRELFKNKLVMFQHRHYHTLSVFFALIVPTLVCGIWGDWIGGLLIGGFLRLFFQYHLTWVINSVAHSYGQNRYQMVGTAKTAKGILGLVLAVLTVGEIYHERHHLAEGDWRLGNRWYDIDIGKWVIAALLAVGLARNPQSVDEDTVIALAEKKAAQVV